MNLVIETQAAKAPGRIKSTLLNWLGFRWTDVEQWRELYGRDTDSGVSVNADTAMRHSSVYACTRLISQRIATLPCNLYRITGLGRELARKHPLFRLLRLKPNKRMTAPVFWEAVVASILLQRGAYLEKILNGGGQMAAIGFLHPQRIGPGATDEIYTYIETDGRRREIPRRKVIYIPAFTTDGEHGVSVIEYGLNAIGNAQAADQAAGKTFKQGLLPTTAFKYPKVLRKEQRKEARETIETLSGAANSGKPIILEADMAIEQIGINPHDAQLLESRQVSAEEICSLFGVFPTMIGRGDKASSWASSSEQLNLWFLNYTLMAWMKRIEAAVTDGFLSPVEQLEYYAEFNPEVMLRGDNEAQREFWQSALQNGHMNRNEVRRMRNLPPMPGGDVFTVQSNLIPIDALGKTDPGANVRAALRAWLETSEQS